MNRNNSPVDGNRSRSTGRTLEKRFDWTPNPGTDSQHEQAYALYLAQPTAQRQALYYWVRNALVPARPCPGWAITDDPTGIANVSDLAELASDAVQYDVSPLLVAGALIAAGMLPTIGTGRAYATRWQFGAEHVGLTDQQAQTLASLIAQYA